MLVISFDLIIGLTVYNLHNYTVESGFNTAETEIIHHGVNLFACIYTFGHVVYVAKEKESCITRLLSQAEYTSRHPVH